MISWKCVQRTLALLLVAVVVIPTPLDVVRSLSAAVPIPQKPATQGHEPRLKPLVSAENLNVEIAEAEDASESDEFEDGDLYQTLWVWTQDLLGMHDQRGQLRDDPRVSPKLTWALTHPEHLRC